MAGHNQRLYRVGDEPVAGYHLQEFLGRGGFGEVWKAIGPGGVPSAIKIIHDLDRKHGGKEWKALRLLRDIRHPNLVPLIAFWLKGEDGGLIPDDLQWAERVEERLTSAGAGARGTLMAPTSGADAYRPTAEPAELVIAMGLAEKSLFDRLRECRDQGQAGVPRDELLTYLDDASRAIDLLNTRHDIQHCDIKPQNILLLSGAAQVCDFGLAKMIGEARETSMGAGTIAYGAPEVLLGKGPTPQTDQYSLAISYFELRTGGLPFCSERISDVLQAKQFGTIDLSALPPAERDVIARAAAIDPGLRFANCQEMVKSLRIAAGESLTVTSRSAALVETRKGSATIVAQSGPSSNRATRFSRAGWIGAAVLGGAALAGLACGVIPHALRLVGRSGASAGDQHSGQSALQSSEAGTPTVDSTASRSIGPATAADSAAIEVQGKHRNADRELARADAVLAEADATLAAAKAALAASQAIPVHPNIGHDTIPSESGRDTANTDAVRATQAIADATRETAQNTRQIAESTQEMVLSLDKLREQLAQAANHGGIVENPVTPSDFYHNARTWEERGDYLNARKAYLRLCTFRLTVVDPYIRFAGVLRLQEGRAGARETLAELAHGAGPDELATRFALLLLEPDETRERQWAAMVDQHPEFAPAVYEWSREFSRDRIGAQGLADMAREKSLLQQFLRLADEGKLLRYFLDQSVAATMLAEANSRLAALQHFEPSALDHPIRLSANPSNSSWTVTLSVAEATREILVRQDNDEFQSTGFLPSVDQRTGLPIPNPNIQLPLNEQARKISVKYVDVRGQLRGPFELEFDPAAEQLASGKQMLEKFPHQWISFREFDGRMAAFFSQLISYRAVLEEVRYGIDSETLSQKFPLPPATPGNFYDVPSNATIYIPLPGGTKFLTVQLLFRDGTVSRPQRFTAPLRRGESAK